MWITAGFPFQIVDFVRKDSYKEKDADLLSMGQWDGVDFRLRLVIAAGMQNPREKILTTTGKAAFLHLDSQYLSLDPDRKLSGSR